MLKLNTSSERAPNGIFSVPDRPQDLMTKIELTYSLWYKLFSEEMIPLIADRRKWHFDEQDLVVNDIVLFKLTDSAMSFKWLKGKIESVSESRDGRV